MLGARNAFSREKASFEIGFEGSVSVNRFKMRWEGIPNRGASMPKTTRCESDVDMRYGEKIEGGRAKLTCWGVDFCFYLVWKSRFATEYIFQ